MPLTVQVLSQHSKYAGDWGVSEAEACVLVVDRKVTHMGEQVTELQGRVDEIHAVVVARKRGRATAAAAKGAAFLDGPSSSPVGVLVESINFSCVNTVWEALEEWTVGLNGFPAITEILARPLEEVVKFSGPSQTALSKRRYCATLRFIIGCYELQPTIALIFADVRAFRMTSCESASTV